MIYSLQPSPFFLPPVLHCILGLGDLKEGGTRDKCTASHRSELELDPRHRSAQQGVLFHLEVHPLVLDFGTSIRDLPRDL